MKQRIELANSVTGVVLFPALALMFILSVEANDEEPAVESNASNLSAIWTVELVGKGAVYELQSELGTFMIHRSDDIDYKERRASGLKSLVMNWDYPSGEPYSLWLDRQSEDSKFKDENHLRVDLTVIAAEIDTAQIAKEVHFDARVESTRPELVPKKQGEVWGGVATEYRNFNTTYYLIEQREAMDGRVIVCGDGAAYCNLYGARVNETLWLRNLMIRKDQVADWKQYQHKARQLINKAIVNR